MVAVTGDSPDGRKIENGRLGRSASTEAKG